jgi:uncharacterized protein (TIGR00730 family)
MNFLKKIGAMLWLSGTYLKIMPQLIIGAWKVGQLPQPIISVFGGSYHERSSKYVKLAEELSQKLVANEMSILTGGGPGIMEAASCGAFRKDFHRAHTVGIAVRGIPREQIINPCVKDYVITDYFPLRKFLLIQYSYAYVIFPGGFGTLDELGEVLTLMQTKKLNAAPVILIGEDFWKPFLSWVELSTKEGLVTKEHAAYITITDDIDKAVSILVEHCRKAMNK